MCGVYVCAVCCVMSTHVCILYSVSLHEHALPAWFLVCKSVCNVYKPACAKLSMYANCVLEKGCREKHLTADAQVEVSVWEELIIGENRQEVPQQGPDVNECVVSV